MWNSAILTPAVATLIFANVELSQTNGKLVYERSAASVFQIVGTSPNKTTELGTGFAVADHLIATNYHIIRGSIHLRVTTLNGDQTIDVAGVKAVDPVKDLALIQTTSKLKPLRLHDGAAQVGEPVYVIGNPHGLSASFSEGIVAAHRDLDQKLMYQITAPISPGSSGGPVLTRGERVIGIASGYLEGGQNLNFAVDADQLKGLIQASASQSPVDVAMLSGAKGQPIAPFKVRIISPKWQGEPHAIDFDMSMLNGGDKAVKRVDLSIVASAQGGLVTHTLKKRLNVQLAPGQTQSEHFQIAGLRFETSGVSNWNMEIRVVGTR